MKIDTILGYLIKHKADGSVENYETWNVRWGFTEQEGINYNETYMQTIRQETFKTILMNCSTAGVRPWDVVEA